MGFVYNSPICRFNGLIFGFFFTAALGLVWYFLGCDPAVGYCANGFVTGTANGQYSTVLHSCKYCSSHSCGNKCCYSYYDCYDTYTELVYNNNKTCSFLADKDNRSPDNALADAISKYPKGKKLEVQVVPSGEHNSCITKSDAEAESIRGVILMCISVCLLVAICYLYFYYSKVGWSASTAGIGPSAVVPSSAASEPVVQMAPTDYSSVSSPPYPMTSYAAASGAAYQPVTEHSKTPEAYGQSHTQIQHVSGSDANTQPVGFPSGYARVYQPTVNYNTPPGQSQQIMYPSASTQGYYPQYQ